VDGASPSGGALAIRLHLDTYSETNIDSIHPEPPRTQGTQTILVRSNARELLWLGDWICFKL